MSPRRTIPFALLMLGACAGPGSQFQERQAQDQRQLAQGCVAQLTKLHDTYCEIPYTKAPVGLSDAVAQQRNSLAMSCKDPESASKLSDVDSCIKEMRAHE